jgi:serine/threonine-protein kinase
VNITTELTAAVASRYRIERQIGKGGMATVYLAQDLKHDRQVALKVLNPELGAMLGAERFLAEIKVTATLQHPNLLPLFDSGEANGLLYYVMPYLEGETLRARLERDGQLVLEDAIRIASGIARALAYAHARGVIHRDLKPENVLLQHGEPIVLDFGIALALRNAGGQRMTQTGISVGTPQYMSPEQASGERVIDARADIYALGTLLYEMLAGEVPHAGPTAQAVIARVMASDPRPLTSVRPTLPAWVAAAVQRALARVPSERFATADDFARALQPPSMPVGPGVRASMSADGSSVPAETGAGARQRLVIVAVGAGLAGFVLGRLSTGAF